jgi:M3 family oligoendopeptidase
MPYQRPDINALQSQLTELIEHLKQAKDFQTADELFHQMDDLASHVATESAIAYIRHSIDTTDAFYEEEINFLDEAGPVLQEYMQNWNETLFHCPFRSEFEQKYGDLLFKNIEIALKAFSPEIISELQQENALCTEYEKLIASAQIPYEGETYTLSQLTPFKQDRDDKRRLTAWNADAGFYAGHQEKLDQIYGDLVALRHKTAQKLGYENFIELGYYRMNRNSYTKEDVELFRKSVVDYLVPVADRICRQQAERLGVSYPLTFPDEALFFRSGNATPKGTPEDILAHGKEFYHELSPETSEFIDFMYENELLDVLSKKGKAGGGYCSHLPDYQSPFIFANFNGTQHDVEVITHEAGHAFAGYTARNIFPSDYQNPTLESCEIHSMSMEFFAWPWAEGFFKEDTEKFHYAHLSGALTFIPYGTMVDHFQHIIYEKPELSPAERHATWRELIGIYMPWTKLDTIPFYGEGHGWQRQQHIYQSPFYYIDYCLAQTVALEFWALMQKDQNEAWKRYLALVRLAGSKTFTELVAAAGLGTPFGPSALETVSAAATDWLDAFDSSKLK